MEFVIADSQWTSYIPEWYSRKATTCLRHKKMNVGKEMEGPTGGKQLKAEFRIMCWKCVRYTESSTLKVRTIVVVKLNPGQKGSQKKDSQHLRARNIRFRDLLHNCDQLLQISA